MNDTYIKRPHIEDRHKLSSCLTGIHHSPQTFVKFCLVAVVAGLLLSGCGGSEEETESGNNLSNVSLDLDMPASITGGPASTSAKASTDFAKSSGMLLGNQSDQQSESGDLPCSYIGIDDEDPFGNGYKATKFMVSAVAVWGCVADLLIAVADTVPHDGSIIETNNDVNAANYDREDPTHYSVIDDSDIQTTVRLYYGFDRELPPSLDEQAGFYVSWAEDEDGTVRGRLLINTLELDQDQDPEDPIEMRMDFTHNEEEKVHDMFMRFSSENPWADGFRIRVVKDLDANPLQKVFVAQGIMSMMAQFLPVEEITQLPEIRFFSVANQMGDGASIAQINNMSLAIPLGLEWSLGAYLTSKQDVYFFDDDQSAAESWDWINKQFTSAVYKGGRTASETGGTWIPFSPSLDMIETALELETGYFVDECMNIGDECDELINTVFMGGFAEQESNQGEDPNDWRSMALQAATYLDTVYPNGVDWTSAFAQNFKP